LLRLNRLQFTSFRSYREFRLLCDSDIVIITGPNAVGKTNIVEGIQLVTGIESFRTSHWAELPTWGSTQARVEASIGGDGRDLNLSLQIEGNKRTYVLNGKRRRASQLRGTLPVVLFTPDDLQLVKSDAQQRRNTLDSIGIQLSSTYASLKADYEKAVRQRNHLLKEEHLNVDIINSWTISLILVGSRFYQHRRSLFEQIRRRFSEIYATMIPQEQADIAYQPSWERELGYQLTPDASLDEVRSVFSDAAEQMRAREYERRLTLIGPHRDELVFTINGRDARKYASQGQQRTLVLAWKLAEVQVIEDIGKQSPVLLLDDVMSELDYDRRAALMEYADTRLQTFITTTATDYFDSSILRTAQVLRLSRGEER
jgi:DNA replication and repair protein RecF